MHIHIYIHSWNVRRSITCGSVEGGNAARFFRGFFFGNLPNAALGRAGSAKKTSFPGSFSVFCVFHLLSLL